MHKHRLGVDVGGTHIKFLILNGKFSEKYIIKTPKNLIKNDVVFLNYEKIKEKILSFISNYGFQNIDLITLSGQMHSTLTVVKDEINEGPYSWQCENKKDTKLIESLISKYDVIDIKRGYPIFNLTKNSIGTYGTILTKLFGDFTGNYNYIHLSEAAGTGFFDLEKKEWDLLLLKKLKFDLVELPRVISKIKFYKHKNFNTKISIPIGDFQMSMATNLLRKDRSLAFNLATGGQIAILNDGRKPIFQSRPSLLNNLMYDCYTQLPAGRIINLLDSKVSQTKLNFDLNTYNFVSQFPDLFSLSEINNYLEKQLTIYSYSEIFHSLLKKYITIIKLYDSHYEFNQIILSGSILKNYSFFSERMNYFFPNKKLKFNDDDVLEKHLKLLKNL